MNICIILSIIFNIAAIAHIIKMLNKQKAKQNYTQQYNEQYKESPLLRDRPLINEAFRNIFNSFLTEDEYTPEHLWFIRRQAEEQVSILFPVYKRLPLKDFTYFETLENLGFKKIETFDTANNKPNDVIYKRISIE